MPGGETGLLLVVALLLRRLLLAGDRPPLSLVRPCVGAGPLTADGKPATVPEAPIAPDVHQSLDVHRCLGAERSLNFVACLDLASEAAHFLVCEIMGPDVAVDARPFEDLNRPGTVLPVDVRQCDLDTLISRQIDAGNSCHCSPNVRTTGRKPRGLSPGAACASDFACR